MEDGKEVVVVGKGDGVDDVGKVVADAEELGSEVEEERNVGGVKSHLEVTEKSGDNDEKVRENCEINEDGSDNAVDGEGMKDVENAEQFKEVAGDAAEVDKNGNVEVELKEPLSDEVSQLNGPESDEVSQLKGPDVEEDVKKTEVSDDGGVVKNLAASDGKKAEQKEASEVNEVQESKEHNAKGEFGQMEKFVAQEGDDNQDADIQIDGAATGKAPDAIEEFQELEKPILQEGIDNQDADIQIDDPVTEMAEHNSMENIENELADQPSAAKDKEDHTECLKMSVAAECQAEAVLREDTVNSVLGAGVTISNVMVENDGDKLDVLSQVDFDTDVQPENGMSQMEWTLSSEKVDEFKENNFETPKREIQQVEMENPKANEEKLNSSLYLDGDESGTEEEQTNFFREVETFFKARGTDFRPPKFYGEPLNLLKLWRAVIRLGGYEQVTSCKLWRQIGESFNPPKTCTTVSWTFRLFYEKALLEFEKHKMRDGELPYDSTYTDFDTETPSGGNHGLGSGRVMRDSAARAMQVWHSQRTLSNGEIGDPIIKDKSLSSTQKREKQSKSNDFAPLKRKTSYPIEQPSKLGRSKSPRSQMEINVIDAGEPANWVKINVRKTKDCFEIYALVPGLQREEVRVQSDPAGRLVISGEPQQLDNPWGVTPFKKVVSLPSRIDPHQTSAVVTLHGQLFVRVPFEQLEGQ